MSKSKKIDYVVDDDEDYGIKPKKQESRRRAIKNWTKAWQDHNEDYDEIDDFYTK